MSKITITIAFLVNITLSVLFANLWMKNIKQQLAVPSSSPDPLQQQYGWIIESFKTFHRELFGLDSVQKIVALLSTYLFIVFVVKSMFEFLIEYFRLRLDNVTKCLNNIVESMLLFTMILGFIVVAMFITNYQIQQRSIPTETGIIIESGEKYSQKLIFIIVQTFFYGRILFTIGYLIGTVTKFQSLRAYGLALTMVSIVIALSQVYDFNIWAYF